MPEISRLNVEVWKKHFRRTYTAAELKTQAEAIAAEAGEMVTITQTGIEGTTGTGTVTGNKLEMLAAVEDLLAEIDAPSARAAAAPVRVIYPTFTGFPH